ncbi:amino acid-binding protein [Rhodobacterales bacterium]|nr:amino acid-binding protein [Rhodobacterales bacterium]
MQTHLVITVLAKDRPGLVERLAGTIAGSGGNWIESSMARLGGEFAGIVRIGIEAAQSEDLSAKLEALSTHGIAITVKPDLTEDSAPMGASAQLDLVSQDHPGILRDITRVLSENGVSIENLETQVLQGSMQGEALFKATANLRLPEGLTPAALGEALEATAADLMADINLVE